jgi:hypothetical protein
MHQRYQGQQEIRGSVAEGSAVRLSVLPNSPWEPVILLQPDFPLDSANLDSSVPVLPRLTALRSRIFGYEDSRKS